MATSVGCWLLIATLVLANDGATEWVEAEAAAEAPWSEEIHPAASGWLVVELEGAGPGGPDLDLELRAADGARTASTSHLPRELLLVAVDDRPVTVTVTAPASGAGEFRLGLTLLDRVERMSPDAPRPEARLASGGERPGRRAALVEVTGAPPGGVTVVARRTSGAGDLDLALFRGGGLPLALGEVAPGEERCRLGPGQGPLLALIRAHDGPVTFTLSASLGEAPSPLEPFLDALARTPQQARVVEALTRNPDFVRIRAYLERYPGPPPIQLRVIAGLQAQGVERFGTYSQGVLTINPTIAGHLENPQELVDTLVHELIHAVLSLPRVGGFPLAPDVLDSAHDEALEPLSGAPLRRGAIPAELAEYLEREYGPSASNPAVDYSDVNAAAQRLIIKVVSDNLARTGVGRETLVFANARARRAAAKK